MKSLYLLTTTALLFFSTTVTAQMEARNGFEEGYRAIQFGIGNNFTLTRFDGSSLSFLKYTSESKAQFIRLTLNGEIAFFDSDTYNSSTEQDYDDGDLDRTQANTDDRNRTDQDFDLDLKLKMGTQNYITTQSDILPFVSKSLFLGSRLGVANQDENRTAGRTDSQNDFLINNQEVVSTMDNIGTNWEPYLGLGLGFGVDYFIAKNISINAQSGFELEYALSFSKSDREYTTEIHTDNSTPVLVSENSGTSGSKITRHSLTFRNMGVLFGIRTYF